MSKPVMIFHEDLHAGRVFELGTRTLSKDEIIAFGRAFDPQPMHTDEEAAKHTLVGGLCASGWHTAGIMMRMSCDGLLNRMASLGSPGVDEMRWRKPIRPGAPYSASYRVLETRDLASRRDVGMSKITVELVDSQGDVAASWISNQLTRRRTPLETPAPKAAAPARAPLPDLWNRPAAAAGERPDGYFDEREVGETVTYPGYTFTREAIIAFAREFDPQPFHLDEDAAKASLFGRLCASGWHTGSAFILRIVEARMQANAGALARGETLPAYGPSPGFRDLRWLKPVYVGDTIEFRSCLARKIDLKSRPTRGLLENDVQGRNQNGEVVFALTSQILAERRVPYRPA